MYKGKAQIEAKTMYIPVLVNGFKSHGVIDSGAQVSILNTELFRKLQTKPKLSDTVVVKGISTAGTIQAEVAEKVALQIGRSKIECNMLVADIEDELILGLDFLETNRVIVDHGQYTITLNKEIISATEMSSTEIGDVKVYRAVVAETTVLPPYSSQFIQVKLDTKPEGDIVIQPSPNLGKVLSPNSLCKPEADMYLLVRNPTDKEATLKKKQLFGSGIEVQMLFGEERCEKYSAKIRKVNTTHTGSKQLPDHLTDLYERSIRKLNECEAVRVRNLLLEYQDVFSKDDFDIGLFNGDVKHRIDTGDAKPIRQKLRRTPLHFEKEEEEHLKHMLEKNVIQVSNSEWAATPVLVRKKDGSLRISDTLPACSEYQPIIELNQLPCGGCDFCTRARNQWKVFEEEVDYAQTIAVRRISPEDGGCNWIEGHTSKEISEEQKRDKDLKCLIEWFERNHQPTILELQLSSPAVRHFWTCRTQLRMVNEVLYYEWEDPVKPRMLLMVPKIMRRQVLELCHNLPLSGHMGQTKTLMKLKQYALGMECQLIPRYMLNPVAYATKTREQENILGQN
ncbi:unnamed protein product [Mytilus edulis]|uniref:Integrase zinc-binding domain-containing protein n=1 Tax=Mytilus edulis TaxID=6550 RepID=A0A8S3RNM2_MYTED|nr:unnamed protein product [Mytilus edulis]